MTTEHHVRNHADEREHKNHDLQKQIMGKVMDVFSVSANSVAKDYPEHGEAIQYFIEALTLLSISSMHGTLGKEFTKGFLQSALHGLDQPHTLFKPPETH